MKQEIGFVFLCREQVGASPGAEVASDPAPRRAKQSTACCCPLTLESARGHLSLRWGLPERTQTPTVHELGWGQGKRLKELPCETCPAPVSAS